MTFYITTPIFYVNDKPHLGHAYTTVIADVINRYRKLFGEETYFLTGTDEHGQKVQHAAEKRGLEPQSHVDEMSENFREIWKDLDINYDIFMRTTFPYHKESVQKCLQYLFDKGEIYEATYEGWYSESEEIFYTDKDLVEGKSPQGKEVQKISEKNYFFKMSNYRDALIQHIESNQNFIMPSGKRSEVLGFLKLGLEDLCISRPKSRLTWGIELPFDSNFVTYVWFDALLNYATALGLHQAEDSNYKKFWPHTHHLVGKDILTTHTVYWPTMLMALDMPLPQTIFAHGWWLTDTGLKMSKSEGTVVTPGDVKDSVGVDSFRYFLCRDIVFGNDAKFSHELVVNRVNSELANNFGNLLNRSAKLVEKYFDSKLPVPASFSSETNELAASGEKLAAIIEQKIHAFEPHSAIGAVVDFLSEVNRYIDKKAPWKSAKENLEDAGESLYASIESLRLAAILLSPVMPTKTKEILDRLSVPANLRSFDSAKIFKQLTADTEIHVGEAVFPRVELKNS